MRPEFGIEDLTIQAPMQKVPVPVKVSQSATSVFIIAFAAVASGESP